VRARLLDLQEPAHVLILRLHAKDAEYRGLLFAPLNY
jgi:hypothetical protein